MAARKKKTTSKKRKVKAELPDTKLIETRGEGGKQLADPHIRQKCKTIREYIEAGVFPEDQADEMLKVMGEIVLTGNNREKIAAYRTILARAKMEHDIEGSQAQAKTVHHQHGHIHINANEIGADLAAAASDLGIQISVTEDLPGEGDTMQPGSARRTQQEE